MVTRLAPRLQGVRGSRLLWYSKHPRSLYMVAQHLPMLVIPMRCQECKNAGRPLLERSGLPEPLHQELFKLGCSRYRHAMAIVSTHILKVFADGGPGEGAFFKKLLPPGNLIRSKAHRYDSGYCRVVSMRCPSCSLPRTRSGVRRNDRSCNDDSIR